MSEIFEMWLEIFVQLLIWGTALTIALGTVFIINLISFYLFGFQPFKEIFGDIEKK